MEENFATLANSVFENFKDNAEIMHNDDSSLIFMPLGKSNEICIIFEDDDFNDYAKVYVEYAVFGKTNEVGVYSLIKCNDVDGAMEIINKKIEAVKENYKVAMRELSRLTNSLNPLAAEMIKNML